MERNRNTVSWPPQCKGEFYKFLQSIQTVNFDCFRTAFNSDVKND